MSRNVSVSALYDSVIERNFQKSRYSSITVQNAFLVKRIGVPSPISLSRQPYNNGPPFPAEEDGGTPGIAPLSIQLRLDGYALAPLSWFRDRGIDPVLMRDESRQYRETFFSIARRLVRRWPEVKWRILHPSGKRVIDVERI